MKETQNKNKTCGNERLTSPPLLQIYIGYTSSKCNHISSATIHLTPNLKEYKHRKRETRVGSQNH